MFTYQYILDVPNLDKSSGQGLDSLEFQSVLRFSLYMRPALRLIV